MAVIGAILGLVGSMSSKIFGIFERKEQRLTLQLKFDHEEKRWANENRMFELQSQAKVAETEQEAFLLTTKGSFDGLQNSIIQQTEATKGASKWVKNIMALIRPILTFTFVGIVVYISVKGDPDNHRSAAIAASIELAMMSVTWWFGDRSAKRITEMRGSHIRAAGGSF